MNVTPLGKISPAAAGTPQAVTAGPATPLTACYKLIFAQIPGTTGKVFIGRVGMNKATYAGVIRVFMPPTATGIMDEFALKSQSGEQLQPSDYAIDADNNGEGALVSVQQ